MGSLSQWELSLIKHRRWFSCTVSTILNDMLLFVMSCELSHFPPHPPPLTQLVFFTFVLLSPLLTSHPYAHKIWQSKRESLSSSCLVQIRSSQAVTESHINLIIVSVSSEHRHQHTISAHIRKCKWRHTRGARKVRKVRSGGEVEY